MKNKTLKYTSRIKSAGLLKKESINSCSTLDKTENNRYNSIADSLKFFVDNSDTIKFVTEAKDRYTKIKYNKQSLFNSIYHMGKFNPENEKKKFSKSNPKYFEYDTNKNNKDKHKNCKKIFLFFCKKIFVID